MVVGVDFSEGSAAAVAESRRLAERLGCNPSFVHVVEDGIEAPSPAEIGGWLRTLGLEQSAIRVLQGIAWIELARHAAAESAALVVVGSHGRSGFQPLWPGRTASRLVIRSSIPVVVVPTGRPSRPAESRGRSFVEHDPEGFRRLEGPVMFKRENQR